MNIFDYPPTIEEINDWILFPFHFQQFTISFFNNDGEIITVDGDISLVFSGRELSWMENQKPHKTILDLSTPFDKEFIESESVIVHDMQGCKFLLILK